MTQGRPLPQSAAGQFGSQPYKPVAYPAMDGYGYSGEGHHHGDDVVRVRRKRNKHRVAKRVALVVAIVLVVLIGAAAAFGLWYANTLSSNMAMNEQDAQTSRALSAVPSPTFPKSRSTC